MQVIFNGDSDVEMESTRTKRESAAADMRERGFTINPILDETAQREDHPEREYGSSNENDLARMESQRSEGWSSIARLRDAWKIEHFHTSAMVRSILLFSGVAPPPSWRSPWMVCRVGWPLIIVFGVVLEMAAVIHHFESNDAVAAYIVSIPSTLGMLAALGSYWWLWPKAHRLIAQEEPLPLEQMRGAVVIFGVYVVMWITAGLAVSVWLVASGRTVGNYPYITVPYSAVKWVTILPIIPALGATLLVLGIETTHATNTVKRLLQAAENKTLTRSMYTTARDRIKERSSCWKWSLGLLAVVALFNTIGLIIILHSPNLDGSSGIANRIAEDIEHVNKLGKETALLFTILILVVPVNNYADSIITVLNNEPWGELGSKEENARLDLLHLATVYSITPEAAASAWKSLTAPMCKPISFRVCGVRPARGVFGAAVISLAGSVVGSLLRSYTGI
jgi:hypothetical protein